MRVQATIPGRVESYYIDERGDKGHATDELWLETYLCSVLRAYAYADDGSGDTIRKIMGVRRFNPVTNTETEHKFLQAAEQLFFRGIFFWNHLIWDITNIISGWQLGSDSVVQVPNNVSNHLTTGLLKYFHTTGRFASGINLFEKLRTKNVEVSSLLAKILFMGNEEVQGVRVLHQSVQHSPMDYVMLDTQAEFLKKKALNPAFPELKEERLKMALGCADRSTVAAPSEFGTWARLAEIYVAMEDWENALTTLNSCPMFTYQDKDEPRMPEPRDIHLPTLPETRLDEIDSEPESRYAEQVHPSLMGLRAAQYKGTFKHAYSILTEMTAKIGWDQLLMIRSNVFVMEEEYRSEKQPIEETSKRNASTDVLRGTPDPPTNGSDAHPEDNETNSSDSIDGDAVADSTNGAESTADEKTLAESEDSVEKPEHTIDKEVKVAHDEVNQNLYLYEAQI
jgi:Chs5-Arf1p-binding protein BUD7/BCH1